MFLELELKPGGVVGFGGNQKEVYKHQPPVSESSNHPDDVFKLKNPIYGLKQASKAWFERLNDLLLKDIITGRIDATFF
jgi:hypothetical protein